jgi:hypothetical protein
MSQKIKHRGKWVDADDLDMIYAAEREAQSPPPVTDVDIEAMPPDVTLAELGDLRPEVRRLITAEGTMRSGLTQDEEAAARKILSRYGGQA